MNWGSTVQIKYMPGVHKRTVSCGLAPPAIVGHLYRPALDPLALISLAAVGLLRWREFLVQHGVPG